MDKTSGRYAVMAGIVSGIPKGTRSPGIDGIVQGIMPKKCDSPVIASLKKVKPSATTFQPGVFGGGSFIEGKSVRK